MSGLFAALVLGLLIGWSGLVPEPLRRRLDEVGTAALLLMLFSLGAGLAGL